MDWDCTTTGPAARRWWDQAVLHRQSAGGRSPWRTSERGGGWLLAPGSGTVEAQAQLWTVPSGMRVPSRENACVNWSKVTKACLKSA